MIEVNLQTKKEIPRSTPLLLTLRAWPKPWTVLPILPWHLPYRSYFTIYSFVDTLEGNEGCFCPVLKDRWLAIKEGRKSVGNCCYATPDSLFSQACSTLVLNSILKRNIIWLLYTYYELITSKSDNWWWFYFYCRLCEVWFTFVNIVTGTCSVRRYGFDETRLALRVQSGLVHRLLLLVVVEVRAQDEEGDDDGGIVQLDDRDDELVCCGFHDDRREEGLRLVVCCHRRRARQAERASAGNRCSSWRRRRCPERDAQDDRQARRQPAERQQRREWEAEVGESASAGVWEGGRGEEEEGQEEEETPGGQSTSDIPEPFAKKKVCLILRN